MKRFIFSSAMVALAMCASVGAANAQNPASSSGDVAGGKKLWVKNMCYTCHGYDGHGGTGARLAPKPIPLDRFVAVVRHPPKSAMPTFTARVVSDADLSEMWNYLSSIPAPPNAKDIPLLNQ